MKTHRFWLINEQVVLNQWNLQTSFLKWVYIFSVMYFLAYNKLSSSYVSANSFSNIIDGTTHLHKDTSTLRHYITITHRCQDTQTLWDYKSRLKDTVTKPLGYLDTQKFRHNNTKSLRHSHTVILTYSDTTTRWYSNDTPCIHYVIQTVRR